MSFPRVFFNPIGAQIPPHFSGIVPIVNPVGPPTFVALGHNGFAPVSQQVHPFHGHGYGHGHVSIPALASAAASVPHHSAHHYDYITVIVLTRNQATGMYEILLPTGAHTVQVNFRRVQPGENPDALIDRMVSKYGLSHFGKLSKIRHIDSTTSTSYKIGVVYAPSVCRARFNQSYIRHHRTALALHRYTLPKHYVSGTIRDNYGHNIAVDSTISNMLYAIGNVLQSLV